MPDESAADRLRLALDMYELGENMLRARLRRQQPQATAAEIESAVDQWLSSRTDALIGDSTGRLSSRF